jgi:hypothetical protein
MNASRANLFLGLFIACSTCAAGCNSKQAIQFEQQAEEIVRLRGKITEANERAEAANTLLKSAIAHSEQLEKSLKDKELELENATQRFANDISQLEQLAKARADDLAIAKRKVAEVEMRLRSPAAAATPVGTWALDDDPVYRFLFFENGSGVFQYWNKGDEQWYAGFPADPKKMAPEADGRFVFTAGRNGRFFELTYSARVLKSPEITKRIPAHTTQGGLTGRTEVVQKAVYGNEERTTTLIIEAESDARLVGWQSRDTIIHRVEKDWSPRSNK